MNPKELVDNIIFRAKHIQEYTVITAVPEGFMFKGPVPFDVRIANGYIEADIFALDFDEATRIFNNWVESLNQDE
jgi:hypothetical protein